MGLPLLNLMLRIFLNKLVTIVKTQAITDIGIDQGLKAVFKFDRNLSTCKNSTVPWWVTAVGGEVGSMVMNGMSGGWAWPANYKDGSSDDVFMTFIMGDNARDYDGLGCYV